jgi:diguanylate cyclase (GGDEF)-like protein
MQNPFRFLFSAYRFAEPAQERRFHEAREAWLKRRFLLIVTLVAGIFLVFIPFDFVLAAAHVPALAAVRVFIAAAVLTVGLLVRFRPGLLPVNVTACLVAALIYAGVFWTRIIVGMDSNYEFNATVMLIQVGVWFLGGMTFFVAAAVNLAGLVIFVALQFAVGEPPHHVWGSGLHLGALLALGGFAAWSLDRLFRRNFADTEELAAQRGEYQARAMRDGLTGLWNQPAMDERLAAALKHSSASGLGSAVLMIDLDRFKPINDQFGHQAGDDILISASRRIQSVLRPGDSVGRIGGDEFLVLAEDLPGASFAGRLAEPVRAKVESPVRVRLFGDSGSTGVSVGASIGISLFSGDAIPADDILNAADRDMYRDKASRKGAPTHAR